MTDDKDLLELAAKAAGITGWQSKHGYWNMTDIEGNSVVCCNHWPKFDADTGKELNPTFADAVLELDWDPLTDDGDALRLSVKLKIDVKHYEGHVVGWFDGGYICTEKIMYAGDPCAATRQAITRAATEIEKAKQ